jgi:hypothetical protein
LIITAVGDKVWSWESAEEVGNMNSSQAVRHGRSSEVVCASLGQMKNQKKLLINVMYLEV